MAQEVVSVLRQLLEIDRSDLAKGFALAGTDAETFKKRVDRAMTDVEKTLDRPTQAVRRLENAMRGDRLLASAGNIVAAVSKIGGASKLSDAEAARYNATLQKAVEKYRLLGQEAPKALIETEKATRRGVVANDAYTASVDKMAAGMKRMGEMGRANLERGVANQRLLTGMSQAGQQAAASQAAQLTRASTASTLANRGFSVLTGTVGQMTAGFTLATVGMRAFDGIVNIGRQAFETADALVDMSAKTGLSSELLQRLDFVADQAGGSIENFTEANYRLGVNLTSGRTGVNKALTDLNLNLAELKRSSPDEQFLAIVDALSRVGNEQDRNRLGIELFGRTYSSIASAVAQDIRKIGDSTKVMADDQVKALADAKDAWGELWKQIQITSGSLIAGLMPPSKDSPGRRRNQAIDAMSFEERREFAQRSDAAMRLGRFDDDAIIADIQRRNAQMDERDRARMGTPGAAMLTRQRSALDLTDDVKALDAAVAGLNAEQKKNIDAAFILGGDAMEQVKAQYELTDDVIRRYSETLKANEKATKDTAKAAEEAARKAAQFNAELVAWAGTDAIENAFKELELLEAAEKQGVTMEMRTAEQIERSKQAFDAGIKAFTKLSLDVPAKITAAFQRSAVALSKNAEYIARFSPMDTSGLTGSPVIGGMVGVAPWRQALIDQDLSQGASAADLTGGILNTSNLENLSVAANGTVMRFKDLNYWMEALHDNLDMLDKPGRNFEGLIRGADMLSRSLDQTGLSVSRMMDSVMVGFEAGKMMKAGGWQNKLAGTMMAASSLASSTSSGNTASRVLGGAASGAVMTAGVASMLGAKTGMWAGPWGAAIGAGAGALYGWARSRMVPQSEKEARSSFADWQRQVIVNFEAMAKAQGLVIGGMRDWDKMVAGVSAAYAATGRTVDDVHRDLKELTDATHKDAASVMAALGKITAAFDEQAQDVEILNGALSEYNFTLDELGEKQIGKTQTAEAKRLADQYRVLLDAGVDVAAVHERMSGSVSKWLQDTMRTGAVIPSAMKPILDNFAKQGQLIDANGLLMDQAAVAALDFKDTWVDGLDRVVVKLDQVLARFAQLLGVPADTLAAAQGNIDASVPAPNPSRTVLTPYGELTVTKKHMGGMVERAHGGGFMASRMPANLFGRMAPDEMPMILQTGEGVLNRRATSLIGGPSAIHSLNAGTPLRDPFDQIGRLINTTNSFQLPAPSALPTSPPGSLRTVGGGGDSFSLTFGPGAISIVSPNAEVTAKQVQDAFIRGLHSGGSFRTTVIRKIRDGH
jgi:hypothetical protein